MIKSSYAVIKSEKLEETAEFYQKYFGFERSFSADWYVSLKAGVCELAILDPNHESLPPPFRGKSSNQGLLLNFETDEVDGVFGKFIHDDRKIHLALRDEAWGQRHFITEDPNGIPLDVIQVIPPAPEFAAQYAKPQSG
jgi:uncharacterized glyoxalase superfamily protein PhnB